MKLQTLWFPFALCALVAALHAEGHPDPISKRVRQIRILEDQRAEIGQFADYIEDDRLPVRRAVFRALGRLQDKRGISALSFFLADHSKAMRYEAIQAICSIGKEEGVPVLLKVTRSSEAFARKLAAYGIGLACLQNPKLDPKLKQRCLSRLTQMLRDRAPGVRGQAALAIGFLKLEAGIAPLAASLQSAKDPQVRWRLVYAIGRIGGEAAVPHLAAAADYQTVWCQEFAALYLSRNKSKAAAAPLIKLAASPRWKVAAVAARGLGKQTTPAAAKALRAALSHWSWHVRSEAARALGETQDSVDLSVALLERRMKREPSRSVRAALLGSLIKLSPRAGLRMTRALLERSPSAPPQLLHAAAGAVAGLAADGKHPAALVLARQLFHRGPHLVRSAILDGLGQTKDKGAIGLLLEGLQVDDLAVRGTAAYLFKDRGDATFLPTLILAYQASRKREFYEVRELLIEGLGTIGKPAVSALQAALTDPAPSVRKKAAEQLEKILGQPVKYDAPKQAPKKPAVDPFSPLPARPEIALETDKGLIRIVLYARAAPIHVRNLLALVQRGFYDGLTFHRVVSAFVIQGGDPRGDGWGDPGYTIRDEINQFGYLPGTLGMPKAGKDTGGCQLFFTHLPAPHLDGRYTVFGQVISGMGTVDRIEVGDKILRARRIR